MRQLYRIEKEARTMTAPERKAFRQEKGAEAIFKAMREKAEALKPLRLPQSSLAKAIRYFLNEYEPLLGYLKNGKFEIDNNLCYRAWIFAVTLSGAWQRHGDTGTRKRLSPERARALWRLNRPQGKEERGTGAPGQGTPRA